MNWDIFGHNHVKRILELQLEAGIFSHTYLFLGSEHLGKKGLALNFAKKLLETEKLENHPDFLMLDESNITIERLREFMENLSLKPFFGKYKVAVVNNAQNLNTQSQNALLKTLEEPSGSTIIVLISSRPPLPTILSRCQIFNFNRFSKKQILEFCESQKLALSSEALGPAFGLPGKIIAKDLGFEDAENLWKTVKINSRAEKLASIAKWSENEGEELEKMLETFLQTELLALDLQPKNFYISNLLLKAISGLKKNFNKKLVLQSLFLSL